MRDERREPSRQSLPVRAVVPFLFPYLYSSYYHEREGIQVQGRNQIPPVGRGGASFSGS